MLPVTAGTALVTRASTARCSALRVRGGLDHAPGRAHTMCALRDASLRVQTAWVAPRTRAAPVTLVCAKRVRQACARGGAARRQRRGSTTHHAALASARASDGSAGEVAARKRRLGGLSLRERRLGDPKRSPILPSRLVPLPAMGTCPGLATRHLLRTFLRVGPPCTALRTTKKEGGEGSAVRDDRGIDSLRHFGCLTSVLTRVCQLATSSFACPAHSHEGGQRQCRTPLPRHASPHKNGFLCEAPPGDPALPHGAG